MMKAPISFSLPVKFLPGKTRFSANISWLVVLPLSLWGISAVYVPILGGSLTLLQTGLVTILIGLLVAFSLVCHVLGHVLVARWLKMELPQRISIFLFGEAAQIWPEAPSTGKTVLVAVAGPFLNMVLVGLAYLLWNAQLNIYLNLSMPFFALYNFWLAVINLAPVFPYDGGGLIKSFVSRVVDRSETVVRMLAGLAWLAVLAEIGWGIFLFSQDARYNLETGGSTLFLAALAAFALIQQRGWRGEKPDEAARLKRSPWPEIVIFVPVFLLLAFLASGLFITNDGIEAPGVVLSVEPMVEIPAQYRHTPTGTFMLTSVLQQSPIPAGVWMLGKFSPVLEILPPEKKAPNQPTPQESARQGFQQLDQSRTTAAVVGLRLAGFKALAVGRGAQVLSIIQESPSQGILKPGDLITAMNGTAVHVSTDLTNLLKTQDYHSTIRLTIVRDQQNQEISVALMPPAQPGGTARIGITIQDAPYDYHLPFPVDITPQKIVGGPSAGLMFTLTLYNLLSPTDLTGGRKIAGTGTINLDGSVGPIGGVQMKVAAAEMAGAEYFLSPADNYADALSVAHQIKVVKVSTVEEALAFLRSLPAR